MTTIEWTQQPGFKGETWNPIAAFNAETGKRGWMCTKPSDGCKNCYAESMNKYRGNALAYTVGNMAAVRLKLVSVEKPFHWRAPRAVFPCSMTDLFHEAHPQRFIATVFAVMALTGRHRYLPLTKRPQRARELLSNERVSCAFCVLASRNDLRVGAKHNPELYNLYVGMERESGFTFQHGKPLADVAPELLVRADE